MSIEPSEEANQAGGRGLVAAVPLGAVVALVAVGLLLAVGGLGVCSASRPSIATHVLPAIIDRTPTTEAAISSAPAPSAADGATSTTVTSPAAGSSPGSKPATATTATTATTTATKSPAATATTTAPAAGPATTPSTTARTNAPTTAPPSTTTSAIAGEALDPGAYLETSDGSDVIGLDPAGVVQTMSPPPEVLTSPARTYRTAFTIAFESTALGAVQPTVRVVAHVENTSGLAIVLTQGFDMHLVCQRSGEPWLDLHVTDPSITGLTVGGTADVATTPVQLTAAGYYSCTATLPILLV